MVDAYAIEEQHVKMDVEVQRRTETLER